MNMPKPVPGWLALIFMLTLLAGCAEEGTTPVSEEAMVTPIMQVEVPPRQFDATQLAEGQALYQQHCAACHGKSAQGASFWRKRDNDGYFPPPPLNGSGHAWHHPRQMLHHMIKNGSPAGMGKMPPWSSTLNDQEIAAIIDWMQSLWPQEVYAAWYGIDQRARQRDDNS